jgi:uncharacterized protein YjdB/tetrahydromethanopterin S-methyltransferase subunit B
MKKNSFLIILLMMLIFTFMPTTVSAHHRGTSYWSEYRYGPYQDSYGNSSIGWHRHLSPVPTPAPQPIPQAVYPTAVLLPKQNIKIYVGDYVTIQSTFIPSNTTVKSVTWHSSNKKIARINGDGRLKALKVGKVKIIVKTSNGKTAKMVLHIQAHKAKSIKLKSPPSKIGAGNSKKLKAVVTPKNTTNKTVSWKSSNSKVLKVNKDGKITALKAGSAIITASTSNGKKTQKKITVYATTPQSIRIQGLSKNYFVGDSIDLTAEVLPYTAKNKYYRALFSNPGMVVNDDPDYHSYTFTAPGNLTVTVIACNGIKSSASLTVTTPIPQIKLDQGAKPEVVNKKNYTISGSVVSRNNSNSQLKLYLNNKEKSFNHDNIFSQTYELTDGLNEITIKAVNSYGKETVLTKKVTFTPPAPNVSIEQGTKDVTVESKSYTIRSTVTDINDRFSELKLYINDMKRSVDFLDNFSETLTLAEGLNEITIKAVNSYGKETVLTKKVTFTPPTPNVSIDQGTKDVTVERKSYTIRSTITDINDRFSELKLYINDMKRSVDFLDDFSETLTLAEGLNEITIKAVNTYGKETVLTKKVTFIPPAPDVSIEQGTNDITVESKNYTIRSTVTDINDKYSELKLYINDMKRSVDFLDDFSETLTLAEGLNEITIKAVNSYGKETVLTKKVTFTPPVPAISLEQGTKNITVESKNYTISGTVTDKNDRYSELKLYINDMKRSVDFLNSFSEKLTLAEGLNTITIRAVNSYGKETILTKEITFTPPAPNILLDQNTNAITVKNNSIYISGNVTDTNDSYSVLRLNINDKVSSINYSGSFYETITLDEGLNKITVKAVNTYGKETVITKEVTYAPPVPTNTTSQNTNTAPENSEITAR